MFSYYTTKEVDDLLAGKAPLVHYHDEILDMQGLLNGMDARIRALYDLIDHSGLATDGTCFSIAGWRTFYSRWECDQLLALKSDIGHTHDFSGIVDFDPNVAMGVLHGLLFELAPDSDLGVRDVGGNGVQFYLSALNNGADATRIVLPGGYMNTQGFHATDGGFDVIGYTPGGVVLSMLSILPNASASTPGVDAGTITAYQSLTVSGDHIIIDGRKSVSKVGNNVVFNSDAAYPNGMSVEGPGLSAPSFSVSSSSAVKHGIVPITDSTSALANSPVYSYRYKGSSAKKVGVMVDEVDGRITDGGSVDLSCMVALSLDALKDVARRAGGVTCH